MRNIVIVTVPHANCFPSKDKYNAEHSCDMIAEEEANKIINELQNYGIEVYKFIGDINRLEIDLNRRESKATNFHKSLDNFIEQNISNKLVLLDIHSGNFGLAPIVIFNFSSTIDDELVYLISDKLDLSNVFIFEGPERDYIIKKVHTIGIPAVLLEFNENKRKREIDNLHKKIASAVLSYFEKRETIKYKEYGKEIKSPAEQSYRKELYSQVVQKKLTEINELIRSKEEMKKVKLQRKKEEYDKWVENTQKLIINNEKNLTKIEYQKFLMRVVDEINIDSLRMLAISKITDKDFLEEIAVSDEQELARKTALEVLEKLYPDIYEKIIRFKKGKSFVLEEREALQLVNKYLNIGSKIEEKLGMFEKYYQMHLAYFDFYRRTGEKIEVDIYLCCSKRKSKLFLWIIILYNGIEGEVFDVTKSNAFPIKRIEIDNIGYMEETTKEIREYVNQIIQNFDKIKRVIGYYIKSGDIKLK